MSTGLGLRRTRSFACLTAATLLLLGACGPAGSGKDDGDELVIAISNEPAALEVMQGDSGGSWWYMTIAQNVVETLAVRSVDGREIEPVLATEWEEDSETSWLISLRDDVSFSDGSRLDADDVVASIQTAIDDGSSYYVAYLSTIVGAEAVDESTVRIETSAHDPALPMRLPFIFVIPDGTNGDDVVGSGPYQVAEWRRGQHVKLEVNDGFRGDKPEYAHVTYKFLTDPSVRAAAVSSGEADIATEMLPSSRVDNLVSAPGLEVVSYMLNQAGQKEGGSPLSDVNVRRAVNHAVDREAILGSIFDGRGTTAQCQVNPSTFPAHNDSLEDYAYDPDLARKLIEDADATGAAVEIYSQPGWPNANEVAQAVANYLSDVGLEPKLHTIPIEQWLEIYSDAAAGKNVPHDMLNVYHSNENFDSTIKTFDGLRSSKAGGGLWTVNSPALDQAIAEAKSADVDEREDAIRDTWKVACDEAVYLALVVPDRLYAVDDVSLTPRADGTFYVLTDVKKGS